MCFLVTYSIEIFYFHIYGEGFYVLSNDILLVLGTKVFLCLFFYCVYRIALSDFKL